VKQPCFENTISTHPGYFFYLIAVIEQEINNALILKNNSQF